MAGRFLRTGAVAAAAVLVLAGCAGAIRIVYESADSFVRWKANGYVALAGADSDELDERIDAFHAWHRAVALPRYAQLAEDAARRVGQGLSQADLVWGYDSLVAQGGESLRAAAEHIAPLLDRVGAEQLRHIERGFAEAGTQATAEVAREDLQRDHPLGAIDEEVEHGAVLRTDLVDISRPRSSPSPITPPSA